MHLLKNLQTSISLSAPLIAALLAQMGMELVNTMMIGRISQEALAAGVLIMASFTLVFIFFIGFQGAAGVLIARFHGAGKNTEIADTLNQAIYLACFLTIPAIILLWYFPELLLKVGENPEVVALVRQYFHAMVWGLPGLSLFFAFRDFVAALSYTRIIFWLSLANIPLAIFFNYLFIFGHGGFPAMGMTGLGYATAVVEWICTLGLIIYILRHAKLKVYLKCYPIPRLHGARLKEILHVGWPVSVNLGFELGMFSVTTLMMGHFGVLPLAAHQIALQLASMAFMLPLGISQGTAILVGQSIGAKDLIQAKHFAWVNLGLGLGLAFITAVMFFSCSKFIISWFINIHDPKNSQLIAIASSYLKVAAFFELLDAVQVIMTGALRGLKDTFVPMILGLVSYWFIGLASGYYFAFVLGFGGIGLWWGLGLGIGVSGVILWIRFSYSIKKNSA